MVKSPKMKLGKRLLSILFVLANGFSSRLLLIGVDRRGGGGGGGGHIQEIGSMCFGCCLFVGRGFE